MTSLQEFRCEVCGLVTTNPTHWFVIRCGDSDLPSTGGMLKPPVCAVAEAKGLDSARFESREIEFGASLQIGRPGNRYHRPPRVRQVRDRGVSGTTGNPRMTALAVCKRVEEGDHS